MQTRKSTALLANAVHNAAKDLLQCILGIAQAAIAQVGTDTWLAQVGGIGKKHPWEDVELGPLIGQGSFGKVYRGVWNGAPVAVKVIFSCPTISFIQEKHIQLDAGIAG